MKRELRPFLIVGIFWFALFLFMIAGYSGTFGTPITGNVVNENGAASGSGLSSIIILVLFFTNLVSLFFLVRALHK